MDGQVALRGHIVSLKGDPFFYPKDKVFVDINDGLVIIRDGIIQEVGQYTELIDHVDNIAAVVNYPDCIITAGFIDTHVHYVQTPIIASFGEHLIDWLNKYTFPEEERFKDPDYAAAVAQIFFDELLRNGTTSASVFCSVFPESVDAFFNESLRRNMRMIGGKVLMDRNAPPAVLDTAQSGYDDSKALIKKWHGRGRISYAITPRFAPTSTEAQLTAAATLHREYPSTLIQTHISENVSEVSWVRSLFPDRQDYLDVYDHAGLLGPGTVLAHGVHLTEREREHCAQTKTAVAHCPTSNLFLGSGLFHMRQAKNPKHPINVGLGTDIGGGTRFSLLETMGEAYKVGELTSYPLDGVKLFYLATLGGAEVLGIADKVGSVEVGKEADLVVLDPRATPLLAFRSTQITSTAEQIFLLAIMGDDRTVAATYVAGRLAYNREKAGGLTP
jgi:guanine deaminase